MKLRACDFRSLGLCAGGLRSLCQQHGYDYLEFVHLGIEHTELESIDDEMIRSYVSQALKIKEAEK